MIPSRKAARPVRTSLMANEIKEILEKISLDKTLTAAVEQAERTGGPVNITGLCEQQKGYIIAALAYKYDKKPVVIVSDVTRAKSLIGGLAPFAWSASKSLNVDVPSCLASARASSPSFLTTTSTLQLSARLRCLTRCPPRTSLKRSSSRSPWARRTIRSSSLLTFHF